MSWGRLSSLGRALLDDPSWLSRALFRRAPSLVLGTHSVGWLQRGDDAQAEWAQAARDATLDGLLASSAGWAPRSALEVDDDLLRELLDDNLLLHDLEPPLVGESPFEWMRARLSGSDLGSQLDALATLLATATAETIAEAEQLLAELPGAGPRALQGALVHQPRRPATVARTVVERAARLGPLLFRLQDALTPPASERFLDGDLQSQLLAAAELYGAGGYDLGAWIDGGYGIGGTSPSDRRLPDAITVAWLTDALLDVERRGDDELGLEPEALDALLPFATAPPTFEIVLSPVAKSPRGDGWLLGLHAPAGASWGRYAEALGAPFRAALDELASLEPPGAVDVAYTPTTDLGDLATHPAVRPACLALSSWPAEAITPAELTLGLEPASSQLTSLWHGETALRPSPLQRLRSTTAPPGLAQLLVGWSLVRQHAPWAVSLGPLADLTRLPRITVDGFVVSPRSWRLPPLRSRRDLGRWRAELDVPDVIQLGHEDELLVLELDDADALDRLQRAHASDERARVFEVWPPLGAELDEDGRRVELVALAFADTPTIQPTAPGAVPPPARAPQSRFRSWKIFGGPDRADRVLSALTPVLAGSASWFFLRYVDGHRHHLRLRIADSDEKITAMLDARLAESRASGDVTSVETGPYFAEHARWLGVTHLAEEVFAADSVDALFTLVTDTSRTLVVAAAYDALAEGAGLTLEMRHALAVDLRALHQPELDLLGDEALAAEYRACSRELQTLLTTPSRRKKTHISTVAAALGRVPFDTRRRLLPALIHLAANRRAGPLDPTVELRALYLWGRALESLRARAR